MTGLLEHDEAHYLRLLVDNVPSMLAYWDRDLLCRFANRSYERWFGVDADALVGKSIEQLLGAELFALNEPYMRAALRGEPEVFERVVPGPHGIKRHSLATYIPDIVHGEVMGFIAHVTEVTQLKETEAALRAEISQRKYAYELLRHSESALRDAQRLGHIGSWEWDVDSDVMVWSEELYRIFGRDPAQPAPSLNDLPALYTAESWSRVQGKMLRLVQGGEPFEIELEYVRPDGTTGWLEAHAEAVRGARDDIQRLRGTCTDITLRRRIDESRIHLEVAQAASRNKTALLSRVSHELRTPLNSILGFSQLLLAEPMLDAKREQWLNLILAGGKHMLELVDELLDMSAAEAGQIVIRQEELDVAVVVSESLRQADVSAQRAGLRLLAPTFGAAPMRISGDPRRA
jgi:PAS domain S-box-containing protein